MAGEKEKKKQVNSSNSSVIGVIYLYDYDFMLVILQLSQVCLLDSSVSESGGMDEQYLNVTFTSTRPNRPPNEHGNGTRHTSFDISGREQGLDFYEQQFFFLI